MAKRRDWIIGLIIAGAFVVFSAVTVMFVAGLTQSDGTPFGTFGQRIAIVELEGTITSSEEVVRQLRRFAEDESVTGIVLRVDSPGGGVAASQEIYNEVHRVRDEGKTVVVSMGSIAASGGLYVASAADWIVANPGTLTGSIGVILQFPTAERLFDKIGLRYETVKSGELKDIGNISRDMTDKEADALQNVIDDTYDQFLTAVAEGRGLEKDSLRPVADGRIFTGRQALGYKIVDELGDLQDAINAAADMTGLEIPPKTVRWEPRRRASILDFLGRSALEWLLSASETESSPLLQYRFPGR